jgi:hypothetical protein
MMHAVGAAAARAVSPAGQREARAARDDVDENAQQDRALQVNAKERTPP